MLSIAISAPSAFAFFIHFTTAHLVKPNNSATWVDFQP